MENRDGIWLSKIRSIGRGVDWLGSGEKGGSTAHDKCDWKSLFGRACVCYVLVHLICVCNFCFVLYSWGAVVVRRDLMCCRSTEWITIEYGNWRLSSWLVSPLSENDLPSASRGDHFYPAWFLLSHCFLILLVYCKAKFSASFIVLTWKELNAPSQTGQIYFD